MDLNPLALSVVVFLVAGCSVGPPTSGTNPPGDATPELSGPPSEPTVDEAQRLLARALEGFGGAEPVDRLRTLVIESTVTRSIGEQRIEATQRTWVEYPRRFRREVDLQGMTIVSVISPEESFLTSPLGGTLPLPEAQRVEMERSLARSPLSLLKGRRHDTATAIVDGEGEIDGRPVDYLRLLFVGDSNRVAIDRETGRILELTFTDRPIGAPEEQAREMTVRFDDFREVDGFVYPFASEITREGELLVTVRVDSVRIDEKLDPSLFEPPEETPREEDPPTGGQEPAGPSYWM